MTINWKQVLEIETYLTNVFDQNATVEKLIWRHPQSINSGIRVEKSKEYSFDDLQNYLTAKFPYDQMIKNGSDGIRELFQLSLSGVKLCETDKELYYINDNQSDRLTHNTIKINLLNKCAEYSGSTSYFLNCLKDVIDKEIISEQVIDLEFKHSLINSFFNYINQILDFDAKDFGIAITIDTKANPISNLVKENFQKLKDITAKFMLDSRFIAYTKSCEKNNYAPPYLSTDIESFFKDLMIFSISEVISIISLETEDYFTFNIRKNESPYPLLAGLPNYGNVNVFITLTGLVKYTDVIELQKKGELLNYIQTLLSKEFILLPKESINANLKSLNNIKNSSLIIGKDIIQQKLYNQRTDTYQEKVISGCVWLHNDVGGIIYDYLEFSNDSDYQGENPHSIPFVNVIFKYLIAYLDIFKWNRVMKEDLENEGYWLSKEHFERFVSGEDDED